MNDRSIIRWAVIDEINSPESGHQGESGTKEWNDGSGVFLELVIERSRRESGDRNVLEVTGVFVMTDRVKERVFPGGASAGEKKSIRCEKSAAASDDLTINTHFASWRFVSAVTK